MEEAPKESERATGLLATRQVRGPLPGPLHGGDTEAWSGPLVGSAKFQEVRLA